MIRFEKSESLQRKIRQDDMSAHGIPTETLARQAIQAGRTDEAIDLLECGDYPSFPGDPKRPLHVPCLLCGRIGLATVCSVVLNGVFLKAGVPTEYRFGGLLEVRNSKPRRFVAIIDYHGTSLDPSEQFIRSNMTSVSEAIKTGNGKILGVFRTIPAPAKEIIGEQMALLKEAGIGGVYALGNTSESICHIPVALNRIGIIQLGGLNPVAAAVEAGIKIENIAESGLIDYQQLQSVWRL